MNNKNKYGWLAPDGIFYPVKWGNHEHFAREYLKEHLSKEDYEKLWKESANCHVFGDYLISRSWVLLHNPLLGLAKITRDSTKGITPKQIEFLYIYYLERNELEIANSILQVVIRDLKKGLY